MSGRGWRQGTWRMGGGIAVHLDLRGVWTVGATSQDSMHDLDVLSRSIFLKMETTCKRSRCAFLLSEKQQNDATSDALLKIIAVI